MISEDMNYPEARVLLHFKHPEWGSYLCGWSSICDAPLWMMKWEPPPFSTDPRIDRVMKKGTSLKDFDGTAEEYVAFNRAGPDESCIGVKEMIEKCMEPDTKLNEAYRQ